MLASIRRTAPVERMRQAFALSEMTRTLVLARLSSRHPDCTGVALAELLHGELLFHVPPPMIGESLLRTIASALQGSGQS